MRAAERIAKLEQDVKDLTAIVAVLKGEAFAKAMTPVKRPAWSKALTPQQNALIGLLVVAYPEPRGNEDLLSGLPGLVEDRDPKQVTLVVHHVRKQLGKDAIKHEPGEGYVLSKAAFLLVRETITA